MKFLILVSAALATVVLASPFTENADGKLATLDGAPPPGCHWEGTSPACDGFCLSGYVERDRGPCGDGACCVTGMKALCCTVHKGSGKKKKSKGKHHTDD